MTGIVTLNFGNVLLLLCKVMINKRSGHIQSEQKELFGS